MKVPPKRKGNCASRRVGSSPTGPLNESPSEKEGKFQNGVGCLDKLLSLNESPSEKEGKSFRAAGSEPQNYPQ